MEVKKERRYSDSGYKHNNSNPKKTEPDAIELQKEQELALRKEDEFHLNQTRVRATKRIMEKRGKPVDFLFSVVRFPQTIADSASFLCPSKVIFALNKIEIEELKLEVSMFKKIDYDHKDYWVAIEILIIAHLKILNNSKEDEGAMHPAILDDVKALLDGKSTEELIKLELFIKQSLAAGQIIDDDYWHAILKKVFVYKAQSKADEYFKNTVRERLDYLLKTGLPQVSVNEIEKRFMGLVEIPGKKKEIEEEKPKVINKRLGRYLNDIEMFKMEEDKGETDDEERFTREVELDDGKSAGKKPLYYNRERRGVDWTKHNQIMYTEDNPPPPTCLGYEFNIFYPDLVDKTRPPRFELLTTENPDLLIIVFKAGPPYKDLAFKIVSSEWEYSQKKGYKCVFSNGIFHLHCWFKRYRYRR